MPLQKKCILVMVFVLAAILCACAEIPDRKESSLEKETQKRKEDAKQWEKGYNLPVDDKEREEAEEDCIRMAEAVSDVYTLSDGFSDETIQMMQEKAGETGEAVHSTLLYSNMENYEKMDGFLEECIKGNSGFAVVYEIQSDGGIGRRKYTFDGNDMYVLSARAAWREDNYPRVEYISYTRIKDWSYTDKGWFCYEMCVPEPPEVTEIVDGSCLHRIKPMTEEQKELSEKCVRDIGYKGNNLLCSDWDAEHMEKLDYNGLYEYLYNMKYQETFLPADDQDGIPQDEFESLLMEYLPVTAEQIREYAAFDKESRRYTWERLGCGNYDPNFFGTSLPEVTNIKENEDGTVTLTVDAVCDMVICDDRLITHELTVRFAEDGSFRYLGNRILGDGIREIPEYWYRVGGR